MLHLLKLNLTQNKEARSYSLRKVEQSLLVVGLLDFWIYKLKFRKTN